ncbi:MAG TPA: flagellar biosynthetic protein FliR [Steroidobacteraceae bacterium]|nr:flagellar biosynthetic protein FliR [Steroidobacteraceae bacterium]
MITLTTGQLEGWLSQLFWPFVRIGACFMLAPAFSAVFIPARIRLVLAGAVALLVAPLVPAPVGITPFSPAGIVVTVQQVIIGLSLGFALQVLFDAVAMGGQLLANSMGLSFAFNVDPMRGTGTPALGQLYALLVMLTFLALDGHLALVEMLVDGFRTLPIGDTGLSSEGLWSVVAWGTQIFSGALAVALPGITALLIVNIAFGVISRAAPSLNLFAVGFPITLVFGLVIILVGLPGLQSSFVRLLGQAFTMLRSLQGGGA